MTRTRKPPPRPGEPGYMKSLMVRDRLPATPAGWWHWALARTLCRTGRHSFPRFMIRKFNGGSGAWLCSHCCLILATGHTRPQHRIRTHRNGTPR